MRPGPSPGPTGPRTRPAASTWPAIHRTGTPSGSWPPRRSLPSSSAALAVLRHLGVGQDLVSTALGDRVRRGGFFLPDLLLVNTAQKRAEQIRKALPNSIDLLTISVESGLGIRRSTRPGGSQHRGPSGGGVHAGPPRDPDRLQPVGRTQGAGRSDKR